MSKPKRHVVKIFTISPPNSGYLDLTLVCLQRCTLSSYEHDNHNNDLWENLSLKNSNLKLNINYHISINSFRDYALLYYIVSYPVDECKSLCLKYRDTFSLIKHKMHKI